MSLVFRRDGSGIIRFGVVGRPPQSRRAPDRPSSWRHFGDLGGEGRRRLRITAGTPKARGGADCTDVFVTAVLGGAPLPHARPTESVPFDCWCPRFAGASRTITSVVSVVQGSSVDRFELAGRLRTSRPACTALAAWPSSCASGRVAHRPAVKQGKIRWTMHVQGRTRRPSSTAQPTSHTLASIRRRRGPSSKSSARSCPMLVDRFAAESL